MNGDAAVGGQQGREQRRFVAEQFRDGNTSLGRLWAYYFGIGGDADELALDAYVHELGELPPVQISLLALAMNEMADEDPLEKWT
jgi:hypothetical protein